MTAPTKRATVIGMEGRSIGVRYGEGACDVLLIRPCDFHVPTIVAGAEVELRYVDHGTQGAWYHAFPANVDDAPPENADTVATKLRELAATCPICAGTSRAPMYGVSRALAAFTKPCACTRKAQS